MNAAAAARSTTTATLMRRRVGGVAATTQRTTTTTGRAASTTSAASSSSSQAAAAAAGGGGGGGRLRPWNVRIVHPSTVFKNDMRARRKAYLQESLDRQREQRATEQARIDEDDRRKIELRERIRRYKEDARRRMTGDIAAGLTGSDDPRPTALDAALGVDNDQQPPLQSDTTLSANDATIAEYVAKRRKVRLARATERIQQRSRQRVESLTYLLHASASFVTYDNLEEKLSAAFDSAMTVDHDPNYRDLEMLARSLTPTSDIPTPVNPFLSSTIPTAELLAKTTDLTKTEMLALNDPPTAPTTVRQSAFGSRMTAPRDQFGSAFLDLSPNAGENDARTRFLAVKDALDHTLAGRPHIDSKRPPSADRGGGGEGGAASRSGRSAAKVVDSEADHLETVMLEIDDKMKR